MYTAALTLEHLEMEDFNSVDFRIVGDCVGRVTAHHSMARDDDFRTPHTK